MLLLPEHPWFANPLLVVDEPLLESLAAEDGERDPASLLFGRLPLRIFGDVLTSDLETLPIGSYLWIMHLSGYFGGVWLRREIARALPDAPLLGVDVLPDEAAFEELLALLRAALDAAAGDDAAVLAYSAGQVDAQLDGYGYNRGYLTEILETPPASLTAPPGYLRAPGLLDARYLVDEIAGLDRLRDRFAAAVSGDPESAEQLTALQSTADARGRAVWSSGLSVQGFPQDSYEQLLELSAYFLQGTQACATGTILAGIDADADLGRRAALLTAVLAPWSVSYRMGLLDGRTDRSLPTWSSSAPSPDPAASTR